MADALSRFKRVANWSLSDPAATKMFTRWGRPDVHLMASDMSRKAPVFFSWTRADQEAWGLDSLAQDVHWNQFELPYCFPPFPLLQQVLDKCKRQEVDRMILVAPWWSGKTFFPSLLEMLLECRRIPVNTNLVVDLVTKILPPDIKRLKLAAC